MNLYTIALAILAIVFPSVFFAINKAQNINRRKVILTWLVASLVISAAGLVGMMPQVAGSMRTFWLLQAGFLGLGFLMHYLLQRKYWGELAYPIGSEVLLILLNLAAGMIGFTLVFNYFSDSDMGAYYSLSVLPFVLPRFIALSFTAYTAIPENIYTIWYFPLHGDEIDFDKVDTSTIYMLELEFSKTPGDERLTNTKLRAPIGMKFGDWFRSYIESWNTKHDHDPIQYQFPDDTPHGWIFYVKPSFLGTPRYIDPERTILENKLSEKKPIIARRVGIV